MSKALIIYGTRTSQTKKIADLIAEGIRLEGLEATVVNVNEVETKGIDAVSYQAIVLGAPTYHGEMLQSMKTYLFALEKLSLEGKVGGAFGSFGWSGEAPGRIYDTMKHIFKMDMAKKISGTA